MKKVLKVAFLILLLVAAGVFTIFYINGVDVAVLNPAGEVGIKESDLIVTASLLMLIIVVPVFILTGFFAWRYREGNSKAAHAPDWEHNYIAEYCWWGVPLIIIGILAVITWKSSHELNPFTPLKSEKKPLKIQVIALQWKWLFLYPEQGVASVNLAAFPEKVPLIFEITSDAPMNSFWIPKLGGQIYAMPAMRTKLHLIANEVGSFRGSSANLSGTGFARMTFTAKATSVDDFESWVQAAKQSAPLSMDAYTQLAEPSENNPVATYVLAQADLFDRVVMKYMEP